MSEPGFDLARLQEIAATPPVFVLGCPRSGTTLFQIMLDTHKDLTVGHECEFITDIAFDPDAEEWSVEESVERALSHPVFERLGVDEKTCRMIVDELKPKDYAEVVRYWFAARALQSGKSRWGNKAPYMIYHLERAARLFPDAVFVHIIRDGRQSAVSWAGVLFDRPDSSQVLACAGMWRRMARLGRKAGAALGPERYTEIHLEDIIASTQPSLERICAFIGIEFDPGMLSYHETAENRVPEDRRVVHPAVSKPPTSGLRSWTDNLSRADVIAVEAMLRSTLLEFGYEPGPRPDSRAVELIQLARGHAVGAATGAWTYRNSLKREVIRRSRELVANVKERAA